MTHLATWPHCVNTTWSSAGFIRNLMKYNELFTHVLQGSLTGSIIPVSMGNPGVCGTIGLYQITATVFTMVGLYCRHPNDTRIFTLANAFRNCWHNKNIQGHLSGPQKAEPGGRTVPWHCLLCTEIPWGVYWGSGDILRTVKYISQWRHEQ